MKNIVIREALPLPDDHIMRSITQPGYGTSDNLALHGGRQNGCGGGLSYTDSDDLARQIFNLWMSSPGHKANQMDDYNAYEQSL
mgnify:CR=1 FL=1